MIITKLKIVINNPPMSVTAQSGMESKNPTSSMACIISFGKTVSVAAPKPAAFMIVDTIPCVISKDVYKRQGKV